MTDIQLRVDETLPACGDPKATRDRAVPFEAR
jgi:hypothetical protein